MHNDLGPKYRSRSKFKSVLLFLIFFISFSAPNLLRADDPGITKIRLIQESDTLYIFEFDIAQSLLNTIKDPILPERFKFEIQNVENNSGWLTITAHLVTKGAPFNPNDEIILPWKRNGVDITIKWSDETVYKGLFKRSLDGIHIPLNKLMLVQKTTKEVVSESALVGFNHIFFKGVHFLLILVLVLVFSAPKVFKYLLFQSLGIMAAMFLVSFDTIYFSFPYVEILYLLVSLLLAYSFVYKLTFRYLPVLLLIIGLLHGISFNNETEALDLDSVQKSQALLSFNIVLDLAHYLFAAVMILLLRSVAITSIQKRWALTVSGGLAIFLIVITCQNHILNDDQNILKLEKKQNIAYNTSNNSLKFAAGQVQKRLGVMTSPAMVFITVEAFEVKKEILIDVAAANSHLKFIDPTDGIIPVNLQENIKVAIQDSIISNGEITIDGTLIKPSEISRNFVTYGKGGVSIRNAPLDENLNEAIIGVTLIYETESYPETIDTEWSFFNDGINFVNVSITDPHGNFNNTLTSDSNTISWKSRLKGYKVPAIEVVKVEHVKRSYASLIIWFLVLLMGFIVYKKKKYEAYKYVLVAFIGLGFIVYPFVRFSTGISFLATQKPSAERASVILNDLMTNVYRAFDKRSEDDVYDRLSLSVTENQLTEIYLQNRQSLEIENRGGAHAKVDVVNILNVESVERNGNDAYIVPAKWMVQGSVNHFGHTHYRQNQYEAMISFLIVDGFWKIDDMEILDTRRIY